MLFGFRDNVSGLEEPLSDLHINGTAPPRYNQRWESDGGGQLLDTGEEHVAQQQTLELANAYQDLFKLSRDNKAAEVRKLLSERRLDVNYRDKDGDTALHRAAVGGHVETAKELIIRYGADIDAQNNDGHTPLMTHVHHSHANEEFVTLLVGCGADLAARDLSGRDVAQMLMDNPRNTITHAITKAVSIPFRDLLINKNKQIADIFDENAAVKHLLDEQKHFLQHNVTDLQNALTAAREQNARLASMLNAVGGAAEALRQLKTSLVQHAQAHNQKAVLVEEVIGAISRVEVQLRTNPF